MPLIVAQPVTPKKDVLSVRLDQSLHDQLKAYAEFIASSKDHVISQAIRHVFRHDKDFAAWLAARPERRPADATPAGVSDASGAKPPDQDDRPESAHANVESSPRSTAESACPTAAETGGHTRRR
jgi:hypothetical protein